MPIDFGSFATTAGGGMLRVALAVTIIGLAFIIRRPAKSNRKEEEK